MIEKRRRTRARFPLQAPSSLVDPRRVDFLSEYLDEKCEEYLGFRRELGKRRATGVSQSVCRKVERSESAMMGDNR